jgi:hypothetical protein
VDQGHLLIYVRNDETGESAYFDYIADAWPPNVTQLYKVDQDRIESHASMTIETSASQEQAILDGIKSMYTSAPDYDLKGIGQGGITQTLINHSETTCTSTAIKLLALGGIDVGTGVLPQTPTNVWNRSFRQFGDMRGTLQTVPRNPPNGGVVQFNRGYDTPPEKNREYGRDPRGQARTLDNKALPNERSISKEASA